MKIAVLLPGHLRAWEYCKRNFLDTIYDVNHNIDVFVDTYNDVFRNDYLLHNENKIGIVKENAEIISLFDGINVVDLKIENQFSGDPEQLQIRKILRTVYTYEDYENKYGKYDLVIRSRCDLLLDTKLDYDIIFESCKNSKLIYIGDGAVHMPQNDMFAICNSDVFKIYGKRFLEHPYVHGSMDIIANKYNIKYSQSIGISIVRLDGPGTETEFNNIKYKIFK